uniref:Transposase (Putative), gypsy type n=1 Tax=Tanacetum cinerariifolium TaxID=118510 RepID=A0A6L2L3V3_TANCI|nr:hypothetical protein [Tanacetum cinerariifolium]
MDRYHSRLTQDDLNELIIRYKIPRDLHPQLPSKEFVMFDLPDNAIGVYHRIFDLSGVRIHFSSFLLALIKHYTVHFSQLGPLGLNKVVTFEKSGFFLIDQRDIPDYMSWRHPDSAINDLKPTAGSFNMEDVRQLSTHVVKLRDVPEGVLVLSGLIMGIHDFLCLPECPGVEVQEEPHHDIRSTLQRLPFYCTSPAVAYSVVLDPTLKDLAASNPSAKVVAKAEGFQKRKASTSGATSSYVAKSIGNQGGGSAAPAAEDISGDVIHRDFFPFSLGPYYATYPEGGGVGNYCSGPVSNTEEMFQIKASSSDQLTAKMSVLYCLMISHGGELLAWYYGSPPFPLPPTSLDYDQAILGHRKTMIRIRDDILEEDMPPRKRFVLTSPLPGCDVAESSAAAARAPRDDVGYVRALHASEHRMMTSIEEVNLRFSYQAQVRKQESNYLYTQLHDAQNDRRDIRLKIDVVRGQRTAYKTELQEVRQAYLSFEAQNRELLARLETLETHMSRMEWQRQSAEDLAVTQMMRIHALEARARIDTVEDASSSC